MIKHIKLYWNNYLSIAAIICSMVAIITTHPSTEELNIDYLGIIIGIQSFLVTILLGWQIWNVIAIDKKINDKVDYLNREISNKVDILNSSLTDNIKKTQEDLQVSGAHATIATLYKSESINLNVCLLTGSKNFRKAIEILSTIVEYTTVLNDPETLNITAKMIIESKSIMDKTGIMAQDCEIIYNSFLKLSHSVLASLPASDNQVPYIYQMINDIQQHMYTKDHCTHKE